MIRASSLALLWWAMAGCDDTSVAVCVGDPQFCQQTAAPVADAGPNQTVAAGDRVILDGSGSRSGLGTIASYAWTQTGGIDVILTDADQPEASFEAPDVATTQTLSFRLTVVNSANKADDDGVAVTVQPALVAATATALSLLDGPLRPLPGESTGPSRCPAATDELDEEQATAQTGLWLAARTLALSKGIDGSDPSGWLDLVRMRILERQGASTVAAAELESFGLLLLGAALPQRDPALRAAIQRRLEHAPLPDDPAALLGGRAQVVTSPAIGIETVADPAHALAGAIARLLVARSECVSDVQAVAVTAASLAVIAAADADPN